MTRNIKVAGQHADGLCGAGDLGLSGGAEDWAEPRAEPEKGGVECSA
jgi:hypothetical protein